MAENLYLNGILIDLLPAPITRNIQIADVGDVSTRKSSFSYTIKIPRTSRNIEALEMLGVIGNQSRKPFEEVVADYVVDGIFLVSRGIAVIKETSEYFGLNIIDGFKSLADLLAGKKLADLDLSDLEHELTTQNYVDSFENTEGFIYAIGDFGLSYGVGNIVQVNYQAPSLFVHTLISRIFSEAGIVASGSFFTNAKYLNEVLTPVKGYLIEDVATKTPKGSVSSLLVDVSTPTVIDVQFPLIGSGLIGSSVVSGDLVFSVAGEYGFDISGTYNNTSNDLLIEVNVNSVLVYTIVLSQGSSLSYAANIIIDLAASDVVNFQLVGTSAGGGSYSVPLDSTIELRTGSQTIDILDSLGDMNQIDLITDISNRYGLIIDPIKNSNEYRFEQIDNVLNYRSTAEDWTEKVSRINSEKYDSGYAKENLAVYAYPEETVISTHDGKMIIDNANSQAERTIVSSNFEVPIVSDSLSSEDIYLVPIWEWNEEEGIADNKETPFKVMNLSREDVSITARLFDEVGGIAVSEDVPFLSLENMSMQYFLDNYYESFKDLIENYKAVEVLLNLSSIDIYNLDFFKLKYLKQTGRFYYLDTVTNTSGKVSKVKLLEITKFI